MKLMKTNYGELPLVEDPTTGRARVRGSVDEQRRSSVADRKPVTGAPNTQETGCSPVSNPAPAPSAPWLSIVVREIPIGKPRMTRRDRWKQRPCVVRYRAWCDAARAVAGWRTKQQVVAATTLTVRAYFPIPSSWSAKKQILAGGQPHMAKPDADNVAKAVLDALIDNDQMVYRIECVKLWDCGAGPRVEIELA